MYFSEYETKLELLQNTLKSLNNFKEALLNENVVLIFCYQKEKAYYYRLYYTKEEENFDFYAPQELINEISERKNLKGSYIKTSFEPSLFLNEVIRELKNFYHLENEPKIRFKQKRSVKKV